MSNPKDNSGIRLMKKGRHGILSAIFSRLGIIILLFLLQVLFICGIFIWFEDFLPHIYGLSVAFSAVMVIYLLNSRADPTVKITWIIIVVILPVFGSLLYIYTKCDIGHRTLKKRVMELAESTNVYTPQDEETLKDLKNTSKGAYALAHYMNRSGCYPVYKNSSITYFPIGEAKFAEMLIQLEKAQKFIFLEYFIISEGVMWGRTLEILAKKAKAGVDVRVMYDGTCELSNLPHDYPKRLGELGIKCKMFAPITPFVSTHYNYRDHRKILVIDGHTAFTGGINLADEYINLHERFGHWKDTAVMVKGEAARSFTRMFLQTWFIDEKQREFEPFLTVEPTPLDNEDCYVIPYGDCPLDSDKVGERVYIDLLNRATKYVHIMTPYLILDGEMEDAIKFASERGVDIRIILPGIPDKKIPYALAITHYKSLLDSGVKLYEYTPGFVHAKVFVCDGKEAVVGTINLDYRSLYHHFECATYMYNAKCIPQIEADFEDTQSKCRTVSEQTVKKQRGRRFVGTVMKVLAPLL